MKFRVIASFAITALALSLFVGCGDSNPLTDEEADLVGQASLHTDRDDPNSRSSISHLIRTPVEITSGDFCQEGEPCQLRMGVLITSDEIDVSTTELHIHPQSLCDKPGDPAGLVTGCGISDRVRDTNRSFHHIVTMTPKQGAVETNPQYMEIPVFLVIGSNNRQTIARLTAEKGQPFRVDQSTGVRYWRDLRFVHFNAVPCVSNFRLVVLPSEETLNVAQATTNRSTRVRITDSCPGQRQAPDLIIQGSSGSGESAPLNQVLHAPSPPAVTTNGNGQQVYTWNIPFSSGAPGYIRNYASDHPGLVIGDEITFFAQLRAFRPSDGRSSGSTVIEKTFVLDNVQ